MHIADVEAGNLGATGVVGGGLATAVGAALSIKMRGTDQVTLCFFGDGAANMGIFHESLNLAAIWELPVVFVCENNQYAMSMSVKRAFPIRQAVSRARSGGGPSLVECKTYRWRGHSKSDAERYRTREEVASWKKKDPIPRFTAHLIKEGILSEDEAQAIAEEAQELIETALAFAESSPEPSVETILEGVYA